MDGRVLGMGPGELVIVLIVYLFQLLPWILFVILCILAIRWFIRQERPRKDPESVAVRRSGDTVPRGSLYLSAGAVDLMYLAVRLAIVELTLPSEEPCPIVLDDALVNLDSARRAAAMEVLGEIAETRQVILFTCN